MDDQALGYGAEHEPSALEQRRKRQPVCADYPPHHAVTQQVEKRADRAQDHREALDGSDVPLPGHADIGFLHAVKRNAHL